MKPKHPAVFLDRDGTILNERGYLSDPRDLHFYVNSFPALRALQKAGYKLIVVTNQSGIGRGYFTIPRLTLIHKEFKRRLKTKGISIAAIYFCPHLPDAGCRCRKPKPFLVNSAIAKFRLDRAASFMIGDQERDVKMGRAAGLKSILVLTGAGRDASQSIRRQATHVAGNILQASRWIVRHGK